MFDGNANKFITYLISLPNHSILQYTLTEVIVGAQLYDFRKAQEEKFFSTQKVEAQEEASTSQALEGQHQSSSQGSEYSKSCQMAKIESWRSQECEFEQPAAQFYNRENLELLEMRTRFRHQQDEERRILQNQSRNGVSAIENENSLSYDSIESDEFRTVNEVSLYQAFQKEGKQEKNRNQTNDTQEPPRLKFTNFTYLIKHPI